MIHELDVLVKAITDGAGDVEPDGLLSGIDAIASRRERVGLPPVGPH